jgi:hypothetical protein
VTPTAWHQKRVTLLVTSTEDRFDDQIKASRSLSCDAITYALTRVMRGEIKRLIITVPVPVGEERIARRYDREDPVQRAAARGRFDLLFDC